MIVDPFDTLGACDVDVDGIRHEEGDGDKIHVGNPASNDRDPAAAAQTAPVRVAVDIEGADAEVWTDLRQRGQRRRRSRGAWILYQPSRPKFPV